jgi:CheY-like chemotaxis protein
MSRRVLVVDDEPALRYLIGRGFRNRGYETVEASDGRAALDVVRSATQPFDLVVTNSRMPHLDGPALAARLRELYPHLPIIHLSGSHAARHKKPMPPEVPTIFKPFNLDDLLDEADKLLRERELERPR